MQTTGFHQRIVILDPTVAKLEDFVHYAKQFEIFPGYQEQEWILRINYPQC